MKEWWIFIIIVVGKVLNMGQVDSKNLVLFMFGAWVGGVLRWRANTNIASTWTSSYTPWKYFFNLEAISQKCKVMGAKYVQTDGMDILHARLPNLLILKLILI